MELSAGVETGMVATGVVAMLGMAVWLFFRDEPKGEKSLFSKLRVPDEEEIEKQTAVLQHFPSLKGEFAMALVKNNVHGFGVLTQTVNTIPSIQQKEQGMKSPYASSVEFKDKQGQKTIEPIQSSSGQSWQRSAGMFSGTKSLGGILVVDDDPDVRRLITIILENAGYDVVIAEDGKEAINVLRSGENPMVVDTIITDLKMPKVDGHEAIAYFQKEFPSIPLIILTGIADVELAVSYMRQGISNYLVKPVNGKKLTASVANAIAQRQLPGG